MPRFSQHSLDQIATLHPALQSVMHEAIKHYDFKVLEGHRSNERQKQLLTDGKTTLGPGRSKHNAFPSEAVDLIPYPFNRGDWERTEKFDRMATYILAAAGRLGVSLRWGGHWRSFPDFPHFELIDA